MDVKEEAQASGRPAQANELEADAFRRLYPVQYHERFFAEGIRPDGRPLGRARTVSVTTGAISCAEGSAAAKIGSSSALAGVRLELYRPEGEAAGQGELVLNIELASFSMVDLRQNRQAESEMVGSVTQRLWHVLGQTEVFDKAQLCIAEGKAAWRVTVDVYVLDADGSVFDACLLAVLSALLDTKLPAVKQVNEGTYTRSRADDPQVVAGTPSSLRFGTLPLSVTCCLHNDYLLVDPTAEEEALAACSVTTVIDSAGTIRGLFKAGGGALGSAMHRKCIEAAKARWKEVSTHVPAAR